MLRFALLDRLCLLVLRKRTVPGVAMFASLESVANYLCTTAPRVTQICVYRDLDPGIRCWGMVACTPCSRHTKPQTDYKLPMDGIYNHS